jgi:hypothetical protein
MTLQHDHVQEALRFDDDGENQKKDLVRALLA